jgi:hypothetical protein
MTQLPNQPIRYWTIESYLSGNELILSESMHPANAVISRMFRRTIPTALTFCTASEFTRILLVGSSPAQGERGVCKQW